MVQRFHNTTLKVICILFCLRLCLIQAKRTNSLVKKGQRRQSINIGDYPDEPDTRRQGRPGAQNGDVYEFHRFQHYGFKTPAPNTFSLESMLAFLAPLATIPIIASAALSSMAAILPSLTTEGMVKGRSRREAVLDLLDSSKNATFSMILEQHKTKEGSPTKRDVGDLDIIHKYLKHVNPKGDYNDEVMASYLQCSGMLSFNNHCLERLVCQFSADGMGAMEKEVSSVIIYTILSNKYIKEDFKNRLREAAFFGRDSNGRCGLYFCSRNDFKSQ